MQWQPDWSHATVKVACDAPLPTPLARDTTRPEWTSSICPSSQVSRLVRLTTGVQLQGPEGAQRLRALSAATSELGGDSGC
jgi:hypothetical protein